ncbi:CARDB domain-containing protein [Chloroflexota bacterium]
MRQKGLFKVVLAFALVLAVGASLWFAAPVKAVDVTLPNLPSSIYSGYLYNFYAQVDIDANEKIPMTSIRLDLSGPTPAWVVFNVIGTIISQSGHFVSIVPVASPFYGYGYRYGGGYSFQPNMGYGYFNHSWGYGYGYGSGIANQAKYLVTINTVGMAVGRYTAQLSVNTGQGAERFLSSKYSITMLLPAAGGGGAPPPPPPPPAPITETDSLNLTIFLVDSKTTREIWLSSSEDAVTIVIPARTTMLGPDGNPIGSIYIKVLNTPPPPPGYTLVGPAWDCGPDGATFEPAITLTFTYDPEDIPAGMSEEDLVMAYWEIDDWVDDEWAILPTIVDTTAHTAIIEVTHFTPFAILSKLPAVPATFAVNNLIISPAEAGIGEKATITVLITNSGDFSGSYEVALKIDGIITATKEVTLTGGASQEVAFTTSSDVAGTYTINVNGLVSTFEVGAAPPASPPTIPAAPPAPPSEPISWYLIGWILAGCIVIGCIIWIAVRLRRA